MSEEKEIQPQNQKGIQGFVLILVGISLGMIVMYLSVGSGTDQQTENINIEKSVNIFEDDIKKSDTINYKGDYKQLSKTLDNLNLEFDKLNAKDKKEVKLLIQRYAALSDAYMLLLEETIKKKDEINKSKNCDCAVKEENTIEFIKDDITIMQTYINNLNSFLNL